MSQPLYYSPDGPTKARFVTALRFPVECYITRRGKQNPAGPALYNARDTILHKVKDQTCSKSGIISQDTNAF